MKTHFCASSAAEAQDALHKFIKAYGQHSIDEAQTIVAFGGDGFILETMHKFLDKKLPIYGIHCGSVGFLMNEFEINDLENRIQNAKPTMIHPLEMVATNIHGDKTKALAFNEVSLLRETRQAAKLEIAVDGVRRLDELICDGILLSTPAGSTAYNLSAHGPIVPIGSNLLALTPISAFRPRRWRGALLPNSAQVSFKVHESDKRPVSAVADFTEVRDVLQVDIRQDNDISVTILFDQDHNLEERILREQFLV